jgi:hypothetical protein
VDAELDPRQVTRLGELLHSEPAQIIGDLYRELTGSVTAIDAGLRSGDLDAVAGAAHAGRNSALLIDARPLLADLEELERCARGDEPQGAAVARERLRTSWGALSTRLEELASKTAP